MMQSSWQPAADSESLDRRHPWLLDVILKLLVVGLRPPVAAKHLVKQAQLTLDEEFDERNLAIIKMRQVDAGVEDATAGILRMLHGAAAQDTDLDAVVEEHEIDRRLQRRRSAIVLGVEEFGVGQRHVTDFAFALDLGAAEIGKPGAAKFGDPLQRLAPRLEHRMDEMHAAAFVGEDVSDKQPLIDFQTFLGALLHQGALSVDLLAASAAAPDNDPTAAATSSETRSVRAPLSVTSS